jgi:farnesyl-diphosphate farnesyltransferase
VLIGLETLVLLVQNEAWLDPAKVSKIQRSKVYEVIGYSTALAASNTALRRWTGSLIERIEARLQS